MAALVRVGGARPVRTAVQPSSGAQDESSKRRAVLRSHVKWRFGRAGLPWMGCVVRTRARVVYTYGDVDDDGVLRRD